MRCIGPLSLDGGTGFLSSGDTRLGVRERG
jgi:hypothetical protein